VAGVFFYSLLPSGTGISASPDWFLGALFGVGGAAGVYLGARLQKRLPARLIKGLLAALIAFVALTYILGYFR
jgi:uncharacterized membrane protein YfcA